MNIILLPTIEKITIGRFKDERGEISSSHDEYPVIVFLSKTTWLWRVCFSGLKKLTFLGMIYSWLILKSWLAILTW